MNDAPSSLTVTVEAAADILGFGRRNLYDAFKRDGYIEAGPHRLYPVRCGQRLMVGRAALDAFCAAIAVVEADVVDLPLVAAS